MGIPNYDQIRSFPWPFPFSFYLYVFPSFVHGLAGAAMVAVAVSVIVFVGETDAKGPLIIHLEWAEMVNAVFQEP